jgi:hypothetical protein
MSSVHIGVLVAVPSWMRTSEEYVKPCTPVRSYRTIAWEEKNNQSEGRIKKQRGLEAPNRFGPTQYPRLQKRIAVIKRLCR